MKAPGEASDLSLALLRARAAGETEGLFGPGSPMWTVSREAALGFGGGAALLLQLAHPLIAAGVAEHSDFQTDPVGRNLRTFAAVYGVIFGDLEDAARVARGVYRRHQAVMGVVPVGDPRAAEPYRATQPELLLWVHATLIHTALQTYQLILGPLSRAQAERYYQDSRLLGMAFGVPEALLPQDLGAFQGYVAQMLEGHELEVGETARRLWQDLSALPAAQVLRGMQAMGQGRRVDAPLGLRWLTGALGRWPLLLPMQRLGKLATAGLLPARLRRGFGCALTREDARALRWILGGLRRVVPRLPPQVRYVGAYRQALRRCRVG